MPYHQDVFASSQLHVTIASRATDLLAAQRLRYQVFVKEMGAKINSSDEQLEQDHFDPYCQHLLVRDRRSGEVVSTTRILSISGAEAAGGFYSENEFDLSAIRTLPGNLIEIGRTCVHPEYRDQKSLAMLWSGLTRFIFENKVDYLFGCASIPMQRRSYHGFRLLKAVQNRHLSPLSTRVQPKLPLQPTGRWDEKDLVPVLPALLKSYLRLGAVVCGDPCWDPDFRVADLLLLLDLKKLNTSYAERLLTCCEETKNNLYAIAC